jgi:hypothetical protein
MTSARIPGPPHWLVRLYLWSGPLIAAVCVTGAVIMLGRGDFLSAARLLTPVPALAGGWLFALRLHRARLRRSNR